MAAAGEGGALVFETLGERTLALGQIARRNDPAGGFDPLLAEYLRPILRPAVEAGIVIVGNFGAANPAGRRAPDRRDRRDEGIGGAPHRRRSTGDDLLGPLRPRRQTRSGTAIWACRRRRRRRSQ